MSGPTKSESPWIGLTESEADDLRKAVPKATGSAVAKILRTKTLLILWRETEGTCRVIKFFKNNREFENEKTALQVLQGSEHVPKLYDAGGACRIAETHWVGFIEREFIDGQPPTASQQEEVSLSLTALATFCATRKISMGDPKPENVLLSENRVTWVDFGWFCKKPNHEGLEQSNRGVVKSLLKKLV